MEILDHHIAMLERRFNYWNECGIYYPQDEKGSIIPEVTIRSMLRAQAAKQRRPFVSVDRLIARNYHAPDEFYFRGRVFIPRRKYMDQLHAVAMITADNVNWRPTLCEVEFHTVDNFMHYLGLLHHDDDLRAAMKVPSVAIEPRPPFTAEDLHREYADFVQSCQKA